MDSVLKDSYLASFCHPPDKMHFCNLFESKSLSSKPMPSSDLNGPYPHSYNILEAPNSKALVCALKTLQEKISRLELEKSSAHSHLVSLSTETIERKKNLSEKEKADSAQQEAIRQKNGVVTQLNSAQQRCSLLEKQLDYMKKMMQNAEMERNSILEQQKFLQQGNIQDKLEKLDLLEKECIQLTATQKIAECKIHQLEEKLHAEQQQRKLMQDKTVLLETGLEKDRIFLCMNAENASQKKVKKKKQMQKKSKGTPQQTFSLKTGDLPFIAGKSTSTSHSLSANVQSVLHMMKHQGQSPRVTRQRSRSAGHKPLGLLGATRTSAVPTVPSTGDSLTDLLLALQNELQQMSCEHQELLIQINETKDIDMREDLEREMDCLVKQMETKSDQIRKLRRHQENVIRLKKAARSMKKLSSSARSAVTRECSKVDPAPPWKKQEASATTATPNSKISLQLLKNVQKIQKKLKKDDIMWEK